VVENYPGVGIKGCYCFVGELAPVEKCVVLNLHEVFEIPIIWILFYH